MLKENFKCFNSFDFAFFSKFCDLKKTKFDIVLLFVLLKKIPSFINKQFPTILPKKK